MSFKVLGTGGFAPARVVTNDELSTFLDTSDEWITQRVGVRERHVSTTETTADMGYAAARKALEMSGTKPEELDLILGATVSGDDVSPTLAGTVQHMLGASCPCMDINSACSAFIFMLDVAAGYFARKKVKKVLVIGAERMSKILDWSDRSTCVIFGDGAGAMVLGEGDDYLSSKLVTKGGDHVIKIPNYAGNSPFYKNETVPPYIHMNGQETFKFAVNSMYKDLTDVIKMAGLTEADIDWVIPHQANARIIDFVARKMDIPNDRFCVNIERYGNSSSASIPILFDEINRAGKFKTGEKIALCGFGGGLSSAACILNWSL
jgi:3-oxoacyl-[acyl-carrier-protein] synthase-3